jgi:TrmH family RNA methyltransferase
LKDIRRLRRSKEGLAVLEGPHLLAEAVAAGTPLVEVLVTPAWAATAEGRAILRDVGCPVEEVVPALLAEMADADTPQGALALARLDRPACDALPRHRGGAYLYLDGIQDPGNLGAIARVAEATGVTAIACSPGTAHPNHPRALRGSAGSLLRLPVATGVAPSDLMAHLRNLEPRWLALEAHRGRDLYEAELAGTVVLALGAEGGGLSDEATAAATEVVRIPLAAPVESLNVATAAAVVLFERRRREGLGGAAPG